MLHNEWSLSAHPSYNAYRYDKIVDDGTAGHPNPYAPTTVCGSGYYYIATHDLGAATAYLAWNGSTGKNCVVTLVHNISGDRSLGATLSVQNGSSGADNGSYSSYAGPVREAAAGHCVKWGGHVGSTSWTSAWGHCG